MRAWQTPIKEFKTLDGFIDYLRELSDTNVWNNWSPEFLVLHHTGDPNLAMYPSGITRSYINMLEGYYRDEKGWSAGPHLFADDHGVWLFTPIWVPGVHAKSFNQRSLGIEMLGNYDVDDFHSGRGAKVRDNAMTLLAVLSFAFSLSPKSIRFHRDEPDANKTCPGTGVDKADVVSRVQEILSRIS